MLIKSRRLQKFLFVGIVCVALLNLYLGFTTSTIGDALVTSFGPGVLKDVFAADRGPTHININNDNGGMKSYRISPACKPNLPNDDTTFQRIYFTSHRRAGGTVLRDYLARVAESYGLTFHHQECGPDEFPPPPGGGGDRAHFKNAIYITHLRDPVQRSLDQFRFEGRWSCKDLLGSSADFQPSYNNSRSLSDWIHTEFQGHETWYEGSTPTGSKCIRRVLLCSTNCYVKWYNWKKGRCVQVNNQTLQTAMDSLYRHHIVIDMDKVFADDNYRNQLEEYFGVSNMLSDSNHQARNCSKASQEANAKYPLLPDPIPRKLLDELRSRNHWDYTLYDQLMTCFEATSFPPKGFSLAFLRHDKASKEDLSIRSPVHQRSNDKNVEVRNDPVTVEAARSPKMRDNAASSPFCEPKLLHLRQITKIHFHSMPMAREIQLGKYLQSVAEFYGVEFQTSDMLRTDLPPSPTTLYVTHLSDPIERSLNSFRYNFRWWCKDLKRTKLPNEYGFVPSLENASPLKEWIMTDFFTPSNEFNRNCTTKPLLCSANCYSRWLVNAKKSGTTCVHASPALAYMALEKLYNNFHLIIDSSRIEKDDQEYMTSIDRFFGVSGVNNKLSEEARMCMQSSIKANTEIPLSVSEDLRWILEKQNALDYTVYNNVTNCADNTNGFHGKSIHHLFADPPKYSNFVPKIEFEPYVDTATSKFRERTSPLCKPTFPETTVSRIVFTHMRKAGGTTLRRYLFDSVGQHYNIPVDIHEAGVDEVPGSVPGTLYITNLRHPVQRSLSHFKFEGRWSCDDLMAKNTTYEPSNTNSHSLQRWMRTEFQGAVWHAHEFPTGPNCHFKAWLCSSNCYIKWLNFKRDHCINELENHTFLEEALDRLYKYHLIVDFDRFSTDPSYGRQLEDYFGVPGLVGEKFNAVCDAKSKAANQKYPYKVDEYLVEELEERNFLDISLYNVATRCHRVNFPTMSLANKVKRTRWLPF